MGTTNASQVRHYRLTYEQTDVMLPETAVYAGIELPAFKVELISAWKTLNLDESEHGKAYPITFTSRRDKRLTTTFMGKLTTSKEAVLSGVVEIRIVEDMAGADSQDVVARLNAILQREADNGVTGV